MTFRVSRTGLLAEDRTADVVVHLDDFTADPEAVAALDVARDAWIARDTSRMQQLVRGALPWCHGLFVALLAKEERSLKSRAKEG